MTKNRGNFPNNGRSRQGTDMRSLVAIYRRYSKGELTYEQVKAGAAATKRTTVVKAHKRDRPAKAPVAEQ